MIPACRGDPVNLHDVDSLLLQAVREWMHTNVDHRQTVLSLETGFPLLAASKVPGCYLPSKPPLASAT